jgi:propanol-preferring alcohol dehydrogenase
MGTLGHEAIGVVDALGPGAERFVAVGDRVILGLGGMGGGYWCGACDYCLSGRPRLCSQGRPLMGTFAEQMCVWAPALVRVPDEIGDEEAPLACGGLTAFGAVRKLVAHGVAPGRTIAVIGAAGGLGHYAVQIANAFGYRVVGVDVGEEHGKWIVADHRRGAQHGVPESQGLGLPDVDAILIIVAPVVDESFSICGITSLHISIGPNRFISTIFFHSSISKSLNCVP